MSLFWWLHGVILGVCLIKADWRGILSNPELDPDDLERR